MKGTRVEELEVADVITGGVKKEVEPQFVDVVGQISLRTLERNSQKKRQKEREQRDKNRPQPNKGQQGNPQKNNPAQPKNQGNPQNQQKKEPRDLRPKKKN
jgi:hypothetical protein